MISLIFLVVSGYFGVVSSTIVGSFVVPHGGIALDPSHTTFANSSSRNLAVKLHKTLIQIGKEIASLQPDLIFLSTPHGLADTDRFLLFLNAFGGGTTFADNCTEVEECAYKLDVAIAADESVILVDELKKSHKVSGLSGFGIPGSIPQEQVLPLGWAEIIPLVFIPNLNSTKVMILSHPTKRYKNSTAMIPELLHLGRSLYLRLHHLLKKVVVIISADLAHTHSKDGPYGYSPAAQPFDDAIETWLSKLVPDALLETAAGLVDQALSCGFTGLVMLHGMLSEAGLKDWIPKLHVIGHPTYFGMAIAQFTRNPNYWSNSVDSRTGISDF